MTKIIIKFKKDLELKRKDIFEFNNFVDMNIDCREIRIEGDGKEFILDIRCFVNKKYDIEIRRINL